MSLALALIGAGTAPSAVGVRALAFALPPSADDAYTREHGLFVAVDADEAFAVRAPGAPPWYLVYAATLLMNAW